MKKIGIRNTTWATANASALHMLTTGVVTSAGAFGTPQLYLTYDTYADGNNWESGSLSDLLEKNVVNEEPYTVKLAQYIKIGTVVVCTFDNTFAGDVGDVMNELCNYWEYVVGDDGTGESFLAWGVSRVQKTDFSDPVTDVAATGLAVYIYETPRQLRQSPNIGAGPIIGIDDRPAGLIGSANSFAVSRPALMIGGRAKPSK